MFESPDKWIPALIALLTIVGILFGVFYKIKKSTEQTIESRKDIRKLTTSLLEFKQSTIAKIATFEQMIKQNAERIKGHEERCDRQGPAS